MPTPQAPAASAWREASRPATRASGVEEAGDGNAPVESARQTGGDATVGAVIEHDRPDGTRVKDGIEGAHQRRAAADRRDTLDQVRIVEGGTLEGQPADGDLGALVEIVAHDPHRGSAGGRSVAWADRANDGRIDVQKRRQER